MSMNVRERAAYAAWKRACAAAQEGEPRERCGTLLGLAGITVLLIGLTNLGGARADSGPAMPKHDIANGKATLLDQQAARPAQPFKP